MLSYPAKQGLSGNHAKYKCNALQLGLESNSSGVQGKCRKELFSIGFRPTANDQDSSCH
jgi:hypothetical protein